MRFTFLATGILVLTCIGCTPETDQNTINSAAWVPVYAQPSEPGSIGIDGIRSTQSAGKIYAYGSYIFQNELNKGIHIIDNSDAAHPHKVGFLKIPFNSDFAIRSAYIYANTINDLVVIDIKDVLHPVIVKTVQDAFPLINQAYPPNNGYFVCPDPSKGIVIDWILQTVKTANCKR